MENEVKLPRQCKKCDRVFHVGDKVRICEEHTVETNDTEMFDAISVHENLLAWDKADVFCEGCYSSERE